MEVLDINEPITKHASEMFEGWGRTLEPIKNVEEYIKKSQDKINFLNTCKKHLK